MSRLEIELELNLVSVIAIMSGLESKEYNTSFNRVRFFVKLLIYCDGKGKYLYSG